MTSSARTESLSHQSSELRVVCRADGRGRIDPSWLARLREALPGARLMAAASLAETHGLEAIDADPREVDALWHWLGEQAPGEATLVLDNGIDWPANLAERLEAWQAAGPGALLRMLAGNYHDELNPLAGLSGLGKDSDPHSLLMAAGTGLPSPCRMVAGAQLFLVHRPDRDRPVAELVDDLFLHDPARALNAGQLKRPQSAAAFGQLRARLSALLAAGVDRISEFHQVEGSDRAAPLTLHITHAWGGGIARWIADQCQGDPAGRHLILSAGGRQDGREHGQRLRLHSGLAGQAPLAEWPLLEPIADTAISHPAYAELLGQIIERYGIGRIIVSSLIGHSLDALRTGLPTLCVLHDFYPASPLLHQDPLESLAADGRLDLGPALSAQAGRLMFEHADADHWHVLGAAWAEAVVEQAVRLIAPTRHVADRWQRLFQNRLPEIAVRPHGFDAPPSWSGGLARKESVEGPLRLVVVGRISQGKGLGLLERSLDALRAHCRLTLLGAGREAYRLFGSPGVDILLDYEAEELPALLSTLEADAVLLLSTVPETWNYVLSEARALGITPMATRLGSFAERIRDGVDGVLFDPDPEALVEAVIQWKGRAEALRSLAAQALAEPGLAEAAQAYRELLPERSTTPSWTPVRGLAQSALGLESEAHRQAESKRAELAVLVDAQREELTRRADWARRAERLSEERTAWARSLDAQLSAERAEHERSRQRMERERERLEMTLEATRAELFARDRRVAELVSELRETQDQLAARDTHIRLMSESWSWRLTRPLRFGTRLLRSARTEQLWNPLRWPGLAGRLLASLRGEGWRGTLLALYRSPVETGAGASEESSTEPLPPVEAPVPRLEPLELPSSDAPIASIVIPVYNKVELTAACLHSLAEHAAATPFEVLVVDDCSGDGTADFLAACEGLRVLRNTKNAGFIDSCNRGAEAARGEFLVFLNNDTTVSEGWLEALLEPLENDPDAGIVGARMVYPDGRLQEAGGIIFNDASGWNYGKFDDPSAPQYGFLSEADYVSGACLALRREDFQRLGGFDTRFRPAYYEDTDLCFQMRQAGKKVLVQPACTIVHHEGATSGTDERSGAKKYQAINRERFAEKWREVLTGHPPPEPDHDRVDPVRHLRYRRYRRRALVIDATTPRPDHDSGSVRIRAVLDLLGARGYQVSFMAENRLYVEGYTDQLTQAGIEVLHAPAVPTLEPWLAEQGRDLDLILVSRHYVLAPLLVMLRQHAPQARLVFDTVDLHYLREQREAELTGDEVVAEQARRTREQELRLIAQADISLVVSPVEQALLAEELPGADVRILSNIHEVHGPGPAWSERAGLLFVGGFQHQPNVDAVRWLAAEIFPRIRAALPEVELHLVGSQMPESVERLGEQPGIRVHGFVADLDPMLARARISLAPLRYGAGVKGKVNQAMSHGLPVVATTCAGEGMFLEHGRDVLLADGAEQFADEVVRLYRDEALWNRLAQGGLANVERHFSRQAADLVLAGLESSERD
ncbi:glycosyltransferase [Wenzhouxiangella marina]|uniref:Glycosyltransferase 2-like domain-containing protein n=1 Tax=Wenzhouxiangella marina TaxID=1579979 RepID=A0A0K0XTQ9_9GAMM|nr:glycosyltransferase [Wenzhouxiangella marina]AKS41007.1 hypothetical protein WM2015_625 [Wenzhouxiangella marina]MBB6087884.1 GT2 family glycosyltransferase [Wenzhouxiangella marina]